MTKPNNSWEIEFDNRDLGCCGGDSCPHYVVRQDENGNNVGTNHDEVLKDFITKTLQQQREEILDNKKVEEIMMKIFKERKAELDVVKFKSNTRAFAVAGIDLIYNYMLEVIKLLQSLKQENK